MSATSFTIDFSAMAKLKALASEGKGKIAVLLPDTQSSARYVSYDAPLRPVPLIWICPSAVVMT